MYNGSIKNQRLFECDNECTVYVAMDKLTSCETTKATVITETTAPDTHVHKSALTDHNSLTVSDSVVFYDNFKNLVRGTVKSVGPSVVEVEVVSSMTEITEMLLVCFPLHK